MGVSEKLRERMYVLDGVIHCTVGPRPPCSNQE